MNTSRKLVWTILRLVILVSLLVGTIDIICIISSVWRGTIQSHPNGSISALSDLVETNFRNPVSPSERYKQLEKNSDVAKKIINYKRLHIDINPSEIVVSYDVYLPKDHPLCVFAEGDWSKDAAQIIANEVLGAVSVSGELLKFDRIDTSIADTDAREHLLVTAAPYRLRRASYQITVLPKLRDIPLNIASKEVIVYTRDARVRTGMPSLPVSKTSEETRYVLAPNVDSLYLQVDTDPAAASRVQTRDSLARVLQKEFNIPGLGFLLIGLLEALPFILFLIWCKRNSVAIPDAQSQQRVVETYLVIHFSYFFFYSLYNLIYDWRNPFILAFSYFTNQKLPIYAAVNYGYSNSILIPMMDLFICAWPTFARVWTEPVEERTSYRFDMARKTVMAFIVIGLVGLLTWVWIDKGDTIHSNLGKLTVGEFYLLFFAISILILTILILLVTQAISLPGRVAFALNLLLVLMLVIAADVFGKYAFAFKNNKYLGPVIEVPNLIIYVAAAIGIVWSFAVLWYRAITHRSLRNDWKEWSANRRALLLVALLAVALSTNYWHWPMPYYPLWSLAWEMKDMFFLVLVLFLAHFLRTFSAEYDWLQLPPLVRDAGILLALFLFYSPRTRWNYIPVSFIVGFLLLKYLLLPRKQFDRSMFSDIKTNLKSLIERVIAFNDAERTFNTLEKALFSKLSKGELAPGEYADKLRAQGEVVEARQRDLIVRNRFAKDHVLALGTGSSAWENGCRTAYYSLAFSIPWSVLYLRDVVRAQVTSDTYLILDLLTNVVYFLLAWISYGFIFGYFYPQIRGKNGIQKALAMFLTVVVPDLIWTALVQPVDKANWISFGFWTLQIFVQMMLLGMIAGDLSIMRAHGFKWRQLLDFYRLTSLSAWTSSVILAIAAAATTLITSEATHILTLAFKYVGVIPENVQLPVK